MDHRSVIEMLKQMLRSPATSFWWREAKDGRVDGVITVEVETVQAVYMEVERWLLNDAITSLKIDGWKQCEVRDTKNYFMIEG